MTSDHHSVNGSENGSDSESAELTEVPTLQQQWSNPGRRPPPRLTLSSKSTIDSAVANMAAAAGNLNHNSGWQMLPDTPSETTTAAERTITGTPTAKNGVP